MNFNEINDQEHLLGNAPYASRENEQLRNSYHGRTVTNKSGDSKEKRKSGSSLVKSAEAWLADKTSNLVLPAKNKPVPMQEDKN